MSAEVKRLYRSRDDRMLAGVAAGLGKYFDIDPTIVRILFALSVFFGVGSGLLIYFILMLVVPEEPLGGEVEVVETVETEEE
jgi:phage shock protein PspC (stress-responsive transcriptional regulator)